MSGFVMSGRAGVAGLVGTFMLLSAGAHGFMGWPAIGAELARTTAPPDLVNGLAIGWWFGSVTMATFAAIVLHLAWQMWHGRATSLVPAVAIGVAYVGFGVAAIAYAGASAPMVSFVVLGAALLAIAVPAA